MHRHVSWVLELELNLGQEEDFRDLMTEMVVATRANEPGTLKYEWSLSADGKHCHLYARCADSSAAMAHFGNFRAHFADRFFEAVTPVRFVVYGGPSESVKEALSEFGPVFMETAAGFSR